MIAHNYLGMNRRTAWAVFLVLILAVLVLASSRLAALRIYQVDECQNLYMAKVLASGQASEFFTNASLFLIGPLSWISRNATRSVDAFQTARLVFLGVFWLNLFLLGLIAGGRLYCCKALVALVAAATLAPLWDYGFEVRHDNVVLAGVLLVWWTIRVKPMGAASYFLAGVVGVALLFTAVKALVYVLPLSIGILAFPPPSFGRSRLRLLGALVIGALSAILLIRWRYGTDGNWETYMSVFRAVAKCSDRTGNASSAFAPWSTLARMLSQTPLLLAMTLAGGGAMLLDVARRGKAVISWESSLPEFLLLCGALLALAINPTPFPYNLVHVVPYVFLFAFRYAADICTQIWELGVLRPSAIAILVFAHVVPFVTATRRHWDYLNWRQQRLMSLAEDLTDPDSDPVYDGVGMVPTRRSVHFQWYLHSLNIRSFLDGSGPRVCDILNARPAAVVIPNYRTDWLGKEDHEFIRGHYVPLSDDFWVLGRTLQAGGGTFEIFHAGRYRISTLKGSDLADTYPLGLEGVMIPEDPGTLTGTLDGAPLSNHPVQLSVGVHRIECAPDCQPAVVWMGPRLERVHRIGPGDHRVLFFNWY